jgi:hypothetical protein
VNTINSPLGKYGQAVAAVIAVGVIGAYVFVVVAGQLLGSDTNAAERSLKDVALIALGAVFGSAAAVNGVKAPIDAAHRRIDKIEVGTGIPTHGAQQQLGTPAEYTVHDPDAPAPAP